MSIYSALEGRSPVNAEQLAQRSRAAAAAAEKSAQEEKEQNDVEHRLLDFFPQGLQPTAVAPPPPPAQPRVIPGTPKLLSSLHSRTPSVSPFTRMGLDFPDEVVVTEEQKQSNDADEPHHTSVSARSAPRTDRKAEQIRAQSASHSPHQPSVKEKTPLVRERTRTQDHSAVGVAGRDPDVERPTASRASAASVAAASDAEAPRSRRIISHAQHINRRPPPQPLSPTSATSPITSSPPEPQPDPDHSASPSAASTEKRKASPASAFLQHLAGLIKTPQQPPPQLHRRLMVGADPDAPAPTGYVPAPFNPRRPASPPSPQSQPSPASLPPQRGENCRPKQPTHKLSPSSRDAPPAAAVQPTAQLQPPPISQQAGLRSTEEQLPENDPTTEPAEDDDDGQSSTSSSSPSSSPSPLASAGEEDEVCASLSSLWRSAKRRQDRVLRPQLEAAAERREQRKRFGKSLITAGLIVVEDGARMSRAERRLVRKGRRMGRDGKVHKMTLEERKAVKMAAVYRQQQHSPALVKEEEQRQQEEAKVGQKREPVSVHTQPLSPLGGQSPSRAASRGVVTSSATADGDFADHLPVSSFPAAPLPPRPATDVVFGRTTALTEEERTKKAKRQQRGHLHAPSLFDLAYGTASGEQQKTVDEKAEKRKLTPPAEEADDEDVQPSGLPLTIPMRLLADPGRSSHIIREGIAKGLPLSLVTLTRKQLTPAQASTALVSAAAAPPPPLQSIRHHKASSAATASATASPEPSSTLSHITSTFAKAPRSPHPPSLAAPSSNPSKRPRLAPKTKERLDRLHAAHRARQARLEGERAAKEAQALDGCTFTPHLAPKTEKMAEKKRLQDELLVQQWERIKANSDRRRMDALRSTATGVPEGEESKADAAVTDGGPGCVAVDGKRSRAHLMHDQYLIQQERKAQQKAAEEQVKAQAEISQCTFDPFASTRSSRRPSVAPSPPSSSLTPTPRSPSLHPVPPRSRTGSVSGHPRAPVNGPGSFSEKRTTPSYEEQFTQERERQQQQDRPQGLHSDDYTQAPVLDLADGEEVQRVVEGTQTEVKSSADAEYAAFAWAVPAFSTHPDGDEEAVPDVDSEEERDGAADAAELAQHRHFILTQTLPPPSQLSAPHSGTFRTGTGVQAIAGTDEVERAADADEEEVKDDGDVKEVARDESSALLSVDVAIAEGRVEQMHLFDGDDIFQAAAAFVARHGLHLGYAEIIEAMLQSQLQEALNTAEQKPDAESPSH